MEVDNYYSELVDFGTVHCGTKFTRVAKVQNNTTIDQTFSVEQYTDRPRLDTGFSVIPAKSPLVRPKEEFTFTIEFVPNTASVRSCDSFVVKHLYGVYCVLVTKAIVKGTNCSLSCSKLILVCPHDKKKISKQVDVKNDGPCIACFQFYPVCEQQLLTVQPQYGTISPSQTIHVTITYTPVNNRYYFKRIFCLISNQEPTYLDVYGKWLKSHENLTAKVMVHDLPTYVDGYHRFFHDVMNYLAKESVPMVLLEKPYIEFGHCQPKNAKQIEFSVTNNSKQKLSLFWHLGFCTTEFKINPTEVEIDVDSCSLFSASFRPMVRDKLSGCILEAQVYSGGDLVPVPVELNLTGNSFEELSCGWSAQYSVEPLSLVLPPCLPSPFSPSHATLTIHRKGHLPLAFRFHPPPLTNFCVKPQQGLVHGSFQIVIVQYYPQTLNEAIDTERWLLTFNSNENVNQCFVRFGCSVETPHVIINHGKQLELPPLHPGSELTFDVDVYNPTRFSFWFNSEVLGLGSDDVLSVDTHGELWPHEHAQLTLVFRPRGVGFLEAKIGCSPVLGDGVVGKAMSTSVSACCCETRLTVNPEKLLMKKVIRDFKHKRVIEITNSGDAIIRGTLVWTPVKNCGIEDFEISMDPQTFFLKPGDSIDVDVSVTPFTIGESELVICYSTSSTCDVPLLPITVESVFMSLQITDIRPCNTAPLFSKRHHWKMMRINELNKLLLNLRPKETVELEMNLPSYVCNARQMYIELLLENNSELASYGIIKPLVSCDCKPVRKQISFSSSKWDKNCPHRCQVELEPASVTVQAGSYVILKMTVSYETVGEIESQFLLQFSPEDYEELCYKVKLRVKRTSIEKNKAFVDTTEQKENGAFVFNMRPVYIGDVKPYAQGFLLYNNTEQFVNFEVEDGDLNGTPFKYIGKKYQIESVANLNLLFTFFPYCCTSYQAEVTLIINDQRQRLILRGTGVCDLKETNNSEDFFPRADKLKQINPTGIFSSTSHISIGPLRPKSTMKDVFFINNNTKDMISFSFLSSRMSEMPHLRVVPAKGLIQPGEKVECRLSCHCNGWPSLLDITLPCAFANFSQFTANIQALNQYYDDLAASHNEFTINEKGSSTNEVTPPTVNWPTKNYLTIGVTVDVRDSAPGGYDDEATPICPPVVELEEDGGLEVTEELKLLITDVLERVLWQVLHKLYRSMTSNDFMDVYYQQIKNLDIQTEIRVPDHVTQNMLEDVLHTAWLDVLQLGGFRGCELIRRRLFCQTALDNRISGRSSSIIPTVTSICDSFTSTQSERLS